MSRASEYRAKSASEVELPSGAKFKLRRPGLPQLLEWDTLPGALLKRPVEPQQLSDEDVRATANLMRDCLVFCCVEPRISATPAGDDELHPGEISMEDAAFILSWAMRAPEAASLRPFRGVEPDAGPGGNGKNVRPAAVIPGPAD